MATFPKQNAGKLKEYYALKEEIGREGTAIVYKGRELHSGAEVSIKLYPHGKVDQTTITQELTILSILNHPNILAYYEMFVESEGFYIIMESCEKFSEKKLTEKSVDYARLVVHQLLKALHHVHTRDLAHLDVRPESLQISPTGEVKLCNFGCATKVNGDDESLTKVRGGGDHKFIAPEVAAWYGKDSCGYGRPADIWSAGVLLYNLLTGNHPFSSVRTGQSLYPLIERGYVDLEIQSPPAARQILSRMLDPDPMNRIVVGEILNTSAFFNLRRLTTRDNVVPQRGDTIKGSVVRGTTGGWVWGGNSGGGAGGGGGGGGGVSSGGGNDSPSGRWKMRQPSRGAAGRGASIRNRGGTNVTDQVKGGFRHRAETSNETRSKFLNSPGRAASKSRVHNNPTSPNTDGTLIHMTKHRAPKPMGRRPPQHHHRESMMVEVFDAPTVDPVRINIPGLSEGAFLPIAFGPPPRGLLMTKAMVAPPDEDERTVGSIQTSKTLPRNMDKMGFGLRLPEINPSGIGKPIKPSDMLSATPGSLPLPEWKRKLMEKKKIAAESPEEIHREREEMEERRRKELEEEMAREEERKKREEEIRKRREAELAEIQRLEKEELQRRQQEELKRQQEEEKRLQEEAALKLKVEAEQKKVEEEAKLKEEEVSRWDEERRHKEFRRRTESRVLEVSGDLNSFTSYLKSETETLQSELTEKDIKIQELVREQNFQKKQFNVQLNNQSLAFSKLKEDRNKQSRVLSEQHQRILMLTRSVENHKNIINRMTEEKNEQDTEIERLRQLLKEKEENIRKQEDKISELKVALVSEQSASTQAQVALAAVQEAAAKSKIQINEETDYDVGENLDNTEYWGGGTFQSASDYFKGYEEFEGDEYDQGEGGSEMVHGAGQLNREYDEDELNNGFGMRTLEFGSYFVEDNNDDDGSEDG